MEPHSDLIYMSKEDLKDMLNCEEKIDSFVESLPEMEAILSRSQQLCQENTTLAKNNMECKEEYEQLRNSTICKVEELSALHHKFNKLTLDYQNLSERLSPSNIQESVVIAATQSEEESENIAEQFLQKNISIDDFLESFMEKKIEYYIRHYKGERLGGQLRELQKAGF